MKAYKAYVTAGKGTLIGGVKTTQSFPFETWNMAFESAQQTIAANRASGRDIAEYGVIEVNCPNPITKSEIA